jgi:hypothetical protein
MFKFTLTTVRPNTNAPFFVNTAVGQVYNEQMIFARSARPTSPDQPNALLEYDRTESADGLTMTVDYTFASSLGKNELFADHDVRATEAGMPLFKTARDEYNAIHGHTTVGKGYVV